jgi:FK506-binding protein 2
MEVQVFFLLLVIFSPFLAVSEAETAFQEENWGDGLKVLVTYRPKSCQHHAQRGDIIHYHYVGRLAEDGTIFGKSFDYNTPYIVALGHGRIIEGMDRGLMGTCLWERRRITFPPKLGYGQQGAGKLIPPNATLVFYIRMVKIERNGESLDNNEERFTDVYKAALKHYSSEKYVEASNGFENVVTLYTTYVNKTLECFEKCRSVTGEESLSVLQKRALKKFEKEFPFATQYLNMAARSRCLRSCKEASMSLEMRTPDPETLDDIRNRRHYAFLHFCYYKQDMIEEGGRCVFSHYFKEPKDPHTKRNIPLYRRDLGLRDSEFMWREEAPGVREYHRLYLEGDVAYHGQNWTVAVDRFERSLRLLLQDLQNCYDLCEDIQLLNFTSSGMSTDRADVLRRFFYTPDAREFPLLMESMVVQYLGCRQECWADVDRINDTTFENTLTTMLNYLQYCYYQVGESALAVQYASTFLAMRPSEEQMARNIKYYRLNVDVDETNYAPIQALKALQDRQMAEERLLRFSRARKPVKRTGQMGDEHVQLSHSEL